MSSKYIDTTAIIQVIGCIYNNPPLLDQTDRYHFIPEDFPEPFHQVVFGAINNIYQSGVNKISISNIEDYLNTRPNSKSIYDKQKGNEWLNKVSENAIPESFNFYYHRMKKMSLLRAYDMVGVNVKDIYDPDNILDIKKKQVQEDWLDNADLDEIANKIEKKIDEIRYEYISNDNQDTLQAGKGIFELLEDLKKHPEVGVPMYGPLINTVTRGARLKKFYLRSAATGVGKSRTMVADACYIGCSEIYDDTFGWIPTGVAQPTLYITTEQELGEIQTMMLAFLSSVNEEHILNHKYVGDEEERVIRAAQIIEKSPLFIRTIPDFSLQDIEDIIKKNIRDNDVKYVFHDYIHTSLKILEEITKRSGGVKLREDNILFMLSIRLKDLCNKYGIFIMSSTQLSGEKK